LRKYRSNLGDGLQSIDRSSYRVIERSKIEKEVTREQTQTIHTKTKIYHVDVDSNEEHTESLGRDSKVYGKTKDTGNARPYKTRVG
jgi:hypothetical protein